MQWLEEYATGSPEVDEQHKMLFQVSDEFRTVLENEHGERTYDVFLDFLKIYSETHFTFEEECMLAHKCPVACRNKHEHAGFSKMIDAELATLKDAGFSRARALTLLGRIDRWLVSHICRIDVELKDVMPG